MKTEFASSPKDEAVVNHSDTGLNEHVTNGYDEIPEEKPGREEDPDTTKKDPEWDQPEREEENDKSRQDDDNDKTGPDTDNDKTAP